MKRKAAEKLFELVYTDAMTSVYNRNAYEEHLEKLRRKNTRLDNITVVGIQLDYLNDINNNFGNRVGDEVVKLMANCILQTVGEKSNVYRMGASEFLCISESDVNPYISELRDLISFEERNKEYPFRAVIGYIKFDNKKHKCIDDIIKDCDRKMLKMRKIDV